MSKQPKQVKLDRYPSEIQKKPSPKKKQIVITNFDATLVWDELPLEIEFKLVPSKIVFSKLSSVLWFDEQEVKSTLLTIPQSLGDSNDFQLKSELDMRGIDAGTHRIKFELHDLFSTCSAIKEIAIEYVPQDRKAAYRKIPIAKKIAGEDFTVLSSIDKSIYEDIEKARRKELDTKRDKW